MEHRIAMNTNSVQSEWKGFTTECYQQLYDESPDLFFSISPKGGKILECNSTALEKLGYSKQDLLGKSIGFIYHEESQQEMQSAFQSFLKNGKVSNAEVTLRRKNGTKLPVLLNVNAVRDSHGNILYSNSCCRDISQIKQLQNELANINQSLEKKIRKRTHELELRNKQLEDFAFIASHDLQEPVRTVLNFTTLLQEELLPVMNDNACTYLQYLELASERMSLQIKALLDYSKIGMNKNITSVDCRSIIEQLRIEFSSQIKSTGAQIEIGQMPVLTGYSNELKMLFYHLIGNALKFKRNGVSPFLRVYSLELGNSWHFSVRDNGIGIPQEYWERIFILFQRLHPRGEYDGIGIGLAHCQKIVELHGGSVIKVRSKLNEGSTFYFSIPKR